MQLTVAQLKDIDDELDLGASSWFKIEQSRINDFAEATEDRQWIHTDLERARASAFGGTIAHGFLVLSLLPKLLFELVEFVDAGMVVNYGLDKVRFMTPVPAGSELQLKARIASATPRAGGVMLRLRGEMVLRERGRRAMIADVLLLIQPPPEDEEGGSS